MHNTFGYLEKHNLIDCIDHVRRSAPDAEIGVWGASMDGATAAQAVGFEDFDNASATRAAEGITMPTLVINSSADDMTPPFMAEDIYNALPEGVGELWTVDDCDHIKMWFSQNDEYRNRVLDLVTRARG